MVTGIGTAGVDIDDAGALEAADVGGRLRGAFTAGAQARAAASALAAGDLDGLRGLAARSLILVGGRGAAARAVRAAAALLAAPAGAPGAFGVPVVVADTAPDWAGALDVLVVCGEDAGERLLAEAVGVGVRRGAEVVVVGPEEGPLGEAAAGSALFLRPLPMFPADAAFVRHLTACVAVATAVSGRDLGLDAVADALDDAALGSRVGCESFVNPAKSLMLRHAGHAAVWAGTGGMTAALAAHAAAEMVRAGVPVAAADLADVTVGARTVGFGAGGPAGPVDDIFHDEMIDGPAPRPTRVFVPVLGADPGTLRAVAALGADPVRAFSAPEDIGPGEATGDRDGVRAPGPLTELAVLAQRIELAAAYAALTGDCR